ncbi:1-acylglycerol-3-phosphate O-acyltransferase [Neisseriaceae bacterium B1]
MNKTSFGTRLVRIWRLLCWFLGLASQFRQLDHATPSERERVLQQAAASALTILNVRIQHDGLPENSSSKGLLVVSNHVSWLDIMVVCSLYPCGFIAMKEIQSWPIIGRIVANAGTVFIDRKNRKDIDPINAAIAQALTEGENVCFYPEARTTLGNNVLPLKAALFQAAINADAAVQALALRYYDGDKRTEAVSFAGVNLLVSLWRIVSIEEIVVRVDNVEAFYPAQLADRFAAKERVEEWLREVVLRDSPNAQRVLP